MADSAVENFFDAIKEGRAEDLEKILDANPDLIDETEDGTPALYVAASYGFSGRTQHLAPIIDVLKARGAPVDLRDAAYLADDEITQGLVSANTSDVDETGFYGMGALHHAAERGTLNVTRILLEAGADPNMQDEFGRKPVDLALHSGPMKAGAALDIVDLILKSGGIADIFVAASMGDLDRISACVEEDASCIRSQKKDGTTALYTAAQNLKPDACRLLVESGADTEQARSNGHTAIMAAVIHMWDTGGPETVQVLSDLGANINQRDAAGRTALDYWIEYSGQGPLAELLRQSGGPGKSIEFLQSLGAEI